MTTGSRLIAGIRPEDLEAVFDMLRANPIGKSKKPLIAELLDESSANSLVIIREEGSNTPKYTMLREDYEELRECATNVATVAKDLSEV